MIKIEDFYINKFELKKNNFLKIIPFLNEIFEQNQEKYTYLERNIFEGDTTFRLDLVKNKKYKNIIHSIKFFIKKITNLDCEYHDIWLQSYNYNDYFDVHNHGTSGTSGIIYLDNIGGTVFVNPNFKNQHKYIRYFNKSDENTLITFPSYLPHYVPTHLQKDKKRNVISFNSKQVFIKI